MDSSYYRRWGFSYSLCFILLQIFPIALINVALATDHQTLTSGSKSASKAGDLADISAADLALLRKVHIMTEYYTQYVLKGASVKKRNDFVTPWDKIDNQTIGVKGHVGKESDVWTASGDRFHKHKSQRGDDGKGNYYIETSRGKARVDRQDSSLPLSRSTGQNTTGKIGSDKTRGAHSYNNILLKGLAKVQRHSHKKRHISTATPLPSPPSQFPDASTQTDLNTVLDLASQSSNQSPSTGEIKPKLHMMSAAGSRRGNEINDDVRLNASMLKEVYSIHRDRIPNSPLGMNEEKQIDDMLPFLIDLPKVTMTIEDTEANKTDLYDYNSTGEPDESTTCRNDNVTTYMDDSTSLNRPRQLLFFMYKPSARSFLEHRTEWTVQNYVFACSFFILTIASIVNLISGRHKLKLLNKHHFILINIFLFVVGLSQATYYFSSSYRIKTKVTTFVETALVSLTFPLISSSFLLLSVSLLNAARTMTSAHFIQQPAFIVPIILLNFALTLLSIIASEFDIFNINPGIYQHITLSILLYGAYCLVFTYCYQSVLLKEKELTRQIESGVNLHGIALIKQLPKLTIKPMIKLSLVIALLGLIQAGLLMTGIFVHVHWYPVNLVYVVGIRAIDVCICFLLIYIAKQPPHKTTSRWRNSKWWHPGGRCCRRKTLDDDFEDWLTHHSANQTLSKALGNQISPETALYPEEVIPMATPSTLLRSYTESETSGSRKSRPASLLINDNGFIRFRQDGEEGGEIMYTPENDLDTTDTSETVLDPFISNLCKRGFLTRAPNGQFFYLGKLKDPDDSEQDDILNERRINYRERYRRKSSHRSRNYSLPGTPHSACSFDSAAWSFKPPSSIHLKDSIENALNIPGFGLRTPDLLDSPFSIRRNKRYRERVPRRRRSHSSLSDLQSMRDWRVRRFVDSRSSFDPAMSVDSTQDDLDDFRSIKSSLYRSQSDSLGNSLLDDFVFPVEMRSNKHGTLSSADRDTGYESGVHMQELLRDINAMCSAMSEIDDRTSIETSQPSYCAHLPR